MRKLRVFRRLLGLGAAKIEVVFFEGERLVVRVVPIRRGGSRCGICRRVYPRGTTDEDAGAGECSISARCALSSKQSRARELP